MSQDKLLALLKVSEGSQYIEILFSISLPSDVVSKYQTLKNSLFSTSDFSLQKFNTNFSPRLPRDLSSGYSKLIKLCSISMNHILDKTVFILELAGKSSPRPHAKNFHSISTSEDHIKDLTELTYDIEELERKIIEKLDVIKENLSASCNSVKVLEEKLRNQCESLYRAEEIESVHIENEKILRENQELKEELLRLKEKWADELENATDQWSKSLEKLKFKHESEIKHLSELHSNEILSVMQERHSNHSKDSEKSIRKRVEDMELKQVEMINGLNDKIMMLNFKSNQDGLFIEQVLNKIEEICDKYKPTRSECQIIDTKERLMEKLKELSGYLELVFGKRILKQNKR